MAKELDIFAKKNSKIQPILILVNVAKADEVGEALDRPIALAAKRPGQLEPGSGLAAFARRHAGPVVFDRKHDAAALRAKGQEFLKTMKMGRTELQDAVPMTVGQEFHAFAAALEDVRRRGPNLQSCWTSIASTIDASSVASNAAASCASRNF